MSDHKFERKYDRRAVLEDEKNRILDLRDFHMLPPEVGIYDEPVRYFKANKQWCQFIFGWLTWMQSESFWKEAQDTNFHAIQQILIFEEGIEGGFIMSPEDFYDANKRAIYDALNDLAKQIVSGRTTGIVVDDDGNVSAPGEDGGVEDDPDTPQNEGLEARSGAAITVGNGLDGLYNKLFALFGVDAEPDTSLGDAQFIIKASFDCDDAAMDAAIAGYYDVRTALFSDYVALNEDELAEVWYCSNGSRSAINDYILLLATPSQTARFNIVELFSALTDAQFEQWVDAGSLVPSTAYVSYDCVPVATYEFDLIYTATAFAQVTPPIVYKHNHRLLLEVSGKITDPDQAGQERDLLYHKSAVGAVAFEGFQMNAAGLVDAGQISAALIPYQSSGIYRFTVDLLDNPTEDSEIIFGRNVAPFAPPNIAGTIHIKITDLGEI